MPRVSSGGFLLLFLTPSPGTVTASLGKLRWLCPIPEPFLLLAPPWNPNLHFLVNKPLSSCSRNWGTGRAEHGPFQPLCPPGTGGAGAGRALRAGCKHRGDFGNPWAAGCTDVWRAGLGDAGWAGTARLGCSALPDRGILPWHGKPPRSGRAGEDRLLPTLFISISFHSFPYISICLYIFLCFHTFPYFPKYFYVSTRSYMSLFVSVFLHVPICPQVPIWFYMFLYVPVCFYIFL